MRRKSLLYSHAAPADVRPLWIQWSVCCIAELYGDYIAALSDYVAFLERLGVIRATVRDAEWDANSRAAVNSLGGVFSALDTPEGPSSGAIASAVLLGAAEYGLAAWQNAAVRDAKEATIVREEARRMADRVTANLEKAHQVVFELGRERGWGRAEMGWDLSGSAEQQVAHVAASGNKVALYLELTRLADIRPRDPVIRLQRNLAGMEVVEKDAIQHRRIAEDSMEALNLIPHAEVYSQYRIYCVFHATLAVLLARDAELNAGAALTAPSDTGSRTHEIALYGLAQDPVDSSGLLRLMVMMAKLSTGQIKEARSDGIGLGSILGGSTLYHNAMAAVYSQTGELDRAVAALKVAVSDGNFTASDFYDDWAHKPLREARPAVFERVIVPQWSWKVEYGILNDDVVFTNNSNYPLTGVALHLFLKQNSLQWTPKLELDFLAPGQTHVWKDAISIPGSRLTESGAKLVCDQNTKR